jgi:AraC-like DNA-binding protein
VVRRSTRPLDWCRTRPHHQAPEKQWTVPELSAAVGLSRSPFAAKFTVLVGQSPMAYLKRWRLQLAATLLRQQAVALSNVAARVGYESTPAFSRAFTRFFGVFARPLSGPPPLVEAP